jgi:hypothetical protein
MLEKIGIFIENNYKYSTDKEDKVNMIITFILTLLSLLPFYFLNIYVGLALTVYCIILIIIMIIDIDIDLPDSISIILVLPFIIPMLIESYIYKLITPYRGNDIKKLRKSKLRKIKRCSIFK